jgi:hypothetical protein
MILVSTIIFCIFLEYFLGDLVKSQIELNKEKTRALLRQQERHNII